MFRYRAKRIFTAFALISLASVARGQKPTAIPLIPAADWNVVSTRNVALGTVSQYGGIPAVDREYGVVSVQLRNCQLGSKKLTVVVESSADPSTAYGLLTFYRTETMNAVAGLPLAFMGNDVALLTRGRYFFRVPRPNSSANAVTDTELTALVFLLGNSRGGTDKSINLPASLPGKDMVLGSEKYLLGEEAAKRVLPGFRTDLMGFSMGAEVQMATYAIGTNRAKVLAINYPTPQISRLKFGEMEKLLSINQDHGLGSVYGRRLGAFVIMVLDAPNLDVAKNLENTFSISTQVTQNEHYPGDKPVVIQMAELVVANLIFVMILAGIAVGGGFLIYLSKEFARRWFPQTRWGSPDDTTFITLKLS